MTLSRKAVIVAGVSLVVLVGVGVAGWFLFSPRKLALSCSNPQIKGNINTAGTKIYHVLGGDFYDQTVIDTNAGERMFCTEDEAVAAGFRKSAK